MQFSRFVEFRKSSKLTMALSVLTLAGACFYSDCEMPATAKSAQRNGSTQRHSDGVVVRKNPDGTVETFDAGSAPEPLTPNAGQSAGQTIRRPIVSRAYSRVIGGVHVRRNSDGTVETYEAPSRPVSLYPTSVRSSKSQRPSKKKAGPK